MRTSCSAVLDRAAALTQGQIYNRRLSALTTFHFHQAGGHTHFIAQESAAGLAAVGTALTSAEVIVFIALSGVDVFHFFLSKTGETTLPRYFVLLFF